MRISLLSLIIILLGSIVLFAQDRQPIHQLHEQQQLGANGPTVVSALARPGETTTLTRKVVGFFPYWVTGYTPPRWDLLTSCIHFEVSADSNGNLTSTHGWPPTWAASARAAGVKVPIALVLFDGDGSQIHYLLSGASRRTLLCHNLVNTIRSNGDGVNVDFELPTTSDAANLTLFMQELRDSLDAVRPGMELSIDVGALQSSGRFNVNNLRACCDYLFIMGYDYHWSSVGHTGPNAPYDDPTESWDVVATINSYLTTTGGSGSGLLLGAPWYGFDWPCSGPDRGAATTGTGTSVTLYNGILNAATYGRMWDTNGSCPWYRYGSYHQGWVDDTISLGYKVRLVNSANLEGYGIWALGYERDNPDPWTQIENNFTGTIIPPTGDTIIIDDGDTNFFSYGGWTHSTAYGGWDGDYVYCGTGGTVDSALWRPRIFEADSFDVYIRWKAGANRATAVAYHVRYDGGSRTHTVDQTGTDQTWVRVGRFPFSVGTSCYVQVDDASSEAAKVAIADATMFIRVHPAVGVRSDLAASPLPLLWPNPVRDFLHLRPSPQPIILMDGLGRVVLRIPPGKAEIDVRGLPEGVYWVEGRGKVVVVR